MTVCLKDGCDGSGDEDFRRRGTTKGPEGTTLTKLKCIKCGTLNLIDENGNHYVPEPVESVSGAKGGVDVKARDRLEAEAKAKEEADAKAKKLEEDKAAAEAERQDKRDEAKAESERVKAAETLMCDLHDMVDGICVNCGYEGGSDGEEEEQPTEDDAD